MDKANNNSLSTIATISPMHLTATVTEHVANLYGTERVIKCSCSMPTFFCIMQLTTAIQKVQVQW